MAILEPDKTVLSIKRKMGQDINLSLGDRQMRPEDISALILKKLKQAVISELNLAEDAQVRAVITVPAYFTEEQRDATKQAAELAGLKLERIINEPTSASLSFGLAQMDEAVYAVYDLGGGTFDVSVIENTGGLVEVLATTGNNYLGGDDFDEELAQKLWSKFLEVNKLQGVEMSKKEKARLLRIAETSKIELSEMPYAEIQENFFFKDGDQNFHLEVRVTRKEFEALIHDKIKETTDLLEKAVKDAKLEMKDLDGIVLVGGSSRIPLVARMIEDKLDIIPILIDSPDEAVSHGATIQGAIIDKIDIDTVLIDITPHSLGIGALSHQLGMEAYRMGILTSAILIPKNSPIPVKNSEKFHSVVDFQKKYEIKVSQGENFLFSDNKEIGRCTLEVVNPVENGEIDVTFELDINGLLKVTAIETTTKERINAEFKSSRGMKGKAEDVVSIEKETIVGLDEASETLLKRSQKLLDAGNLSPEDDKDLKELMDKFKKQKESNHPDMENTEVELLDLLYYLEEN